MNKWNSSGYPKPTGSTTPADRFADINDGLDTALTNDSGTSDPSSGAPSSWGADEVGRLWYDTTNQRYGTGDDLGGQTRRWERDGGASYSFRLLNAVGHVAVSPSTNVLDLSAQGTVAWTDLDFTTTTSSFAIRALIQITYTDRALALSTNSYVGIRPNGVTTEVMTRRVYAPASKQPTQIQMWCELDSSQILEYAITPSSGADTMASLRIDVLGYHERI